MNGSLIICLTVWQVINSFTVSCAEFIMLKLEHISTKTVIIEMLSKTNVFQLPGYLKGNVFE